MPLPLVPDDALSHVEQFIGACIDNGCSAVKDGIITQFSHHRLQELQAMLQYLQAGPYCEAVASINAAAPAQTACNSHALEDFTESISLKANTALDDAALATGSAKGSNGALGCAGCTPTGLGSTREAHGQLLAAACAPMDKRSSNELPRFRIGDDQIARGSTLSQMPDSDDAIFSSFMETLDFVDPSEFPCGSSRALHANATIRSIASSIKSRSSLQAFHSHPSARLGPPQHASPTAPTLAAGNAPVRRSSGSSDTCSQSPLSHVVLPSAQGTDRQPNITSAAAYVLRPTATAVSTMGHGTVCTTEGCNNSESIPSMSQCSHGIGQGADTNGSRGSHSSDVASCKSMSCLQAPSANFSSMCKSQGPCLRDPTETAIWNEVVVSMGSWDTFDVSKVANKTRAPLLVTSFAAFTVLGLMNSLNIRADLLIQFLKVIEALYPRSNPYHNSTHAADVVQAVVCMLLQDRLTERFTDLEVLAMMLAAIVHDVGHPGVTNQFLRSSKDDLSYMFSNKSVAENASLAIGLGLLANDQCNFLRDMDAASVEAI
eukprot:jgi/Ulvmu1/1154/UM107_0028.1